MRTGASTGAEVAAEDWLQALRASAGIAVPVGLLVLILCVILGAAKGIQYTLDAISYGSIFALLAMGLALLFGVMGLMNFAYGELIMAGAYTMYFTRSWGWLGMIVTTIIIVTILSLLMELLAFRMLITTPRTKPPRAAPERLPRPPITPPTKAMKSGPWPMSGATWPLRKM